MIRVHLHDDEGTGWTFNVAKGTAKEVEAVLDGASWLDRPDVDVQPDHVFGTVAEFQAFVRGKFGHLWR